MRRHRRLAAFSAMGGRLAKPSVETPSGNRFFFG